MTLHSEYISSSSGQQINDTKSLVQCVCQYDQNEVDPFDLI